MPTLTVDLPSQRYPILIEAGGLDRAGELLHDHITNRPLLIITDAMVAEHYGQRLQHALQLAGCPAGLVSFPAGEPVKNLQTADVLWQACATHGIDRSGVIIALGGGVTGDLAGFVAAGWMRGVRFIQVPTSLLAMVDSSVGGKTGVNAAAGKNLIGAFHQPQAVLIDPLLLASMDTREYRAGLAEVIKYGIIKDPDFLSWQEEQQEALNQRLPAALAEAVGRSCAIKASYVAADEREGGIRAHLNYGHTFGHALERDTHYQRYLHGEAVAIGMRMAACLAEQLGLLADEQLIPRQDALIRACGLPLQHQAPVADAQRLVAHCGLDKKVDQGHTRFVLPRAIGQVEIVRDPPADAVAEAFTRCFAPAADRG
jgi:3-dehydroquinate synthase